MWGGAGHDRLLAEPALTG
ncbi:hypothetical protein ACFSHQ_12590 [Gemmobacter lanyuensis]